ncbi:hypothetical protein ACC723_38415, partial [Rhizobium ruizarguesonis]
GGKRRNEGEKGEEGGKENNKRRGQQEDGDRQAEGERRAKGKAGIGAVVTFAGLCREEGGRLGAIELEREPGRADAEQLSGGCAG